MALQSRSGVRGHLAPGAHSFRLRTWMGLEPTTFQRETNRTNRKNSPRYPVRHMDLAVSAVLVLDARYYFGSASGPHRGGPEERLKPREDGVTLRP